MKIVLTVHQFLPENVTGTEQITYYLACNLRQRGHEVMIVTTASRWKAGWGADPRLEKYEYDGLPVYRLHHAGGWLARALMERSAQFRLDYDNPAMGTWFREFLDRQMPDVVHFVHLSFLSASLIDACAAAGIPSVFTATDFWPVCPLSILRLPDGSMCGGPDAKAGNCVRHVRETLRDLTRARKPPGWKQRLRLAFRGPSLREDEIVARPAFIRERFAQVGRILVPSLVMRDTLLANGFPAKTIRYLPYGTPVNQIERTVEKERQGPLRVGYIGQISEHKGCHVLAEAANLVPEVPLQVRFHGDPNSDRNYGKRLRDMMSGETAGGGARMAMAGLFAHRDLSGILRGIEVLVCPSLWYENTPLVIYEAMAAGVPVVATDLPGMAEVIKPGVNGMLFPKGDARALAEILRQLAQDRPLVARMAANTEPPLSAARHAERVEEVYHQVLAEAAGQSAGGEAGAAAEFKYQFETLMPAEAEVGKGMNFILEGWAYCPGQALAQLEIEMSQSGLEGGRGERRRFAVAGRGDARKDVLAKEESTEDAVRARALQSGFWCLLPVEAMERARKVSYRLVATLQNGETVYSAPRRMRVRGSALAERRWPPAAGLAMPRICICMATYNPTEEMFRRQVDSIRAQAYTNWVCLVQDDWSSDKGRRVIERVLGDDPRFVVEWNERNHGFYENFERVLRRVPADCELVALSDQDDRWNADKLARLVACFDGPDVMLAYSDMRIVDGKGAEVSPTYWTQRRNNYTDIESLFFANTITGAASLFRASLLPRILPFPEKRGTKYHDWWIALVALACGKVRYVEAPLYDYYQHAGNAVGWSTLGRSVVLRDLLHSDTYRRELAHVAQKMYNYESKYLAAAIATLRLRVRDSHADAALQRLSGLGGRPVATLLVQSVRSLLFRRASENRERNLLMAHIVMRLLNRYFATILRTRAPEHAATEDGTKLPGLDAGGAGQRIMHVDSFERRSRPLRLEVTPGEPERVNMLLATIDFRLFFGGYIGMFQLARQLARAGKKVRIVTFEPCDYQPDDWRRNIRNYAGLEDIFDHVEIELRADRGKPLAVSARDRWIATSCWSAWIADAAARQLGGRPFIFMIQEYEPYFVPHGSYYALSHAAYGLNHFGLFSTEMLRQFFRQERYGVYAESAAAGDARSVAFQNAVLGFDVRAESLLRHGANGSGNGSGGKRKFLYYCRPEAHAQRNMFELGVLALRRAVAEGTLDPGQWQFYGMGTVGDQFVIPLGQYKGRSAELVALPKMSLEAYANYLPDFDLGMSLMFTPHPSLVPLEMASAGLVTVTNSYANKTAEALRAISTNFEVGAPNIDGLTAALSRAAARVEDVPARVAGSHIDWPTSWGEALGPQVMDRLLRELNMPPSAAAISLNLATV